MVIVGKIGNTLCALVVRFLIFASKVKNKVGKKIKIPTRIHKLESGRFKQVIQENERAKINIFCINNV